MHKTFRNLLLLIFIFISIFSNDAFAIKFLDIDEYDSVSERKGLRIVIYNTDVQKFESIRYYEFHAKKAKTNFGGVTIEWKKGETTKISCNKWRFSEIALSVLDKFNVIITGRKDIEFITNEHIRDGRIIYWKKMTGSEIKSGQYIMEQLNGKTKRGHSGDAFQVKYWKYKSGKWSMTRRIFSQIIAGTTTAIVKANNIERGRLGELATTLTMTGYGYRQYPSKHGGVDNGFDGVFCDDSDKPELFITEAKCRVESTSAERYMKDCLSEYSMVRVLPKLKERASTSTTSTKIEEFIKDCPERIFKLVQRVLRDGRVQCLVKKFNKEAYRAGEFIEDEKAFYAVGEEEEIGALIDSFRKRAALANVVKMFVETIQKKYKDLPEKEIKKILEDSFA